MSASQQPPVNSAGGSSDISPKVCCEVTRRADERRFSADMVQAPVLSIADAAALPMGTTHESADVAQARQQQPPPQSSGKLFSNVEPAPALSATRVKPEPTPATPQVMMTDLIERVINAAETREASSMESSLATTGHAAGRGLESNLQHGGPLAMSELSSLSQHCAATASVLCFGNSSADNLLGAYNAWTALDGDLVSSLTPMLQVHVKSAVGIDLVGEGREVIRQSMERKDDGPVITIHQWMMQNARYSGPNAAALGSLGDAKVEPGAGFRRLQVLLSGLESANILLSIMSSPGIDRRAVEDDAIEACVNLIKNHLQKNIAPSLSNTGHLGVNIKPGVESDGEDGDDGKAKKKRRSVSPQRGVVAKSLKAVYAPILSTVGTFGTILERAEAFIIANEMDDRLLFTLSAAALSSLTIDASTVVRADTGSLASIVQVSALNLCAAMCTRYPRHRSILVEDLFPLMLKLPSKKMLRNYLIKRNADASVDMKPPPGSQGMAGDHAYIQPITALTLLLIQSCVVMPQSEEEQGEKMDVDGEGDEASKKGKMDSEDDNDDEIEETEEEKRLEARQKANTMAGLDGCVLICNQFTSQMLQRCARKGEEGGASEFRPILSNLIDDLLLVRYLVDFPAAEMLLMTLSHRLGADLLRASSAPKNTVEATYLATAMDAFGKITSAVASTLLEQRENPFELPNQMSLTETPEPKEEVNRCFCGRDLDTFMLDCDRCHSWFHGSCVGITKDAVPETWVCDDCTLQGSMLDQAKAFTQGKDSLILTKYDHNNVLRQFLLSYLSRNALTSPSPQADRAREFFIATWVKDINLEQNEGKDTGAFDLNLIRAHAIAQWQPPTVQQQYNLNAQLTEHGNKRTLASLVASSELSTSFPRLLGVLLRLMGDSSTTSLRKLSLKSFLRVVNNDPSLMTHSSVKKEVARCFHDDAISVREAAVGLVGDYVLHSPNLAKVFHAPLLERMKDKGISVRKRAVKIFRDMLLSNPSYSGRAQACHVMLLRAADRKEDDGVRDLVHETFHTLWFSGKAFEVGSSNGAADKTTKAQLYAREVATQMTEVVKVSGSPEVLTSLVTGLLFGFSEGDKDKKVAERKKRQVDSKNQCHNLVLALVELLLSFEESRQHKEDDGKELVALLSTLSVFAEAYPELLVGHVDTLIPYLKGDNGGGKKYEASIVSTCSAIITLAVPHFSAVELHRLSNGGLPADLVNIAYKFPPTAVSSAVETLATLANHPGSKEGNVPEKKLITMARQFYSYLLKQMDSTCDFSGSKKSIRDNVKRALSALGSICRFYECDSAIDAHNHDPNGFQIVAEPKSLKFEGNMLSDASFALFRSYLAKKDESSKVLALRAMNGVFISRPRVVLAAEQLGIISSVISDDAPPSVQIESLKCWRDILLAEEKRIESGAARAKMMAEKKVALSKRISGDQDGDACISGSVLTKHARRLYEMKESKDDKVRLMVIDLIGHLLRQGLINPMETVPHLLAVQGDVKSPQTRALALKLLINEGEKRPEMLRQRVCAGIVQAYHFQNSVYNASGRGATALLTRDEAGRCVTETIFDAVIKESGMKNKRAQRQGLLKGILSLFEKDPGEQFDHSKLPLLSFAAEILAHLPYTTLNDPLFCVYNASCISTLDGQTVVKALAEVVGGDVCDPNSGEDEIEQAVKKGNFDAKKFGLKGKEKEFGQLCVDASRIIPLLLLKNFLRKAYNLSEARIVEYLPSEKERINEKGVSILPDMQFSCKPLPLFIAGKLNWSIAAKVYTNLRQLMRDSETALVADEVKKSPKRSRGGRKRARSSSGDDADYTPAAPGKNTSSPKVSPPS